VKRAEKKEEKGRKELYKEKGAILDTNAKN